MKKAIDLMWRMLGSLAHEHNCPLLPDPDQDFYGYHFPECNCKVTSFTKEIIEICNEKNLCVFCRMPKVIRLLQLKPCRSCKSAVCEGSDPYCCLCARRAAAVA